MGIASTESGAIWLSVELRELRVFLTFAEQLHFGHAADRLGINRSRVSQIISRLEAKVGGRLFERTSRRVRLTAAGERLRDNLGAPYAELERGFADAREVATGVAGVPRIGIYSRVSCGPHWLSIVRTFKTRRPGCDVEIIDTGFGRNYLAALRGGEVDMLATRLPLSDDDMTVGPILSREPRVLLVAQDDPLADRDSVSVEDFAGRAIGDAPSFPRELMDAFFPPSSPSGLAFPRITLRSFEELLMLVATGQIVHPTVESFPNHYALDGIAHVPISDLPSSETAIVWLSTNRSERGREFAQAAADVLGPRSVLVCKREVGTANGSGQL